MTDLRTEILILREKGLSYREIEKKLQCAKSTVAYHLTKGQKEKTSARTKSTRSIIRKFVKTYKENNPCHDCFQYYPSVCMEFDHLGDKKFNVSNFKKVTSSIIEVMKEMDKCDLVCANCHRIRTYKRNQLKKKK